MINAEFAQNFITKINRQLQYNINIMNEKAIIIASSSPERIGSFHSCAHRIIQNKQFLDITETPTEDLIGVTSPGVNLLLLEGIEPIGVVGVSGPPDEVMGIAKTIKFALEAMLEYRDKLTAPFSLDRKAGRLTYALLFERPQNPSHILKLVSQSGYSNHCPRRSVLICFSGVDAGDTSRILDQHYGSLHIMQSQDILLPIDSQHMLLLKAIPANYQTASDAYLEECLGEMDDLFVRHHRDNVEFGVKYLCGITQASTLQTGQVYECLSWLERYVKYAGQRVVNLRDYLLEYLVDHTPPQVISIFFDEYCQRIEQRLDVESFKSTIHALVSADMKPEAAAGLLYMHKNTIAARIKKIKETLDIQPFTDTKDAIFLIALYEYLMSRTKLL